MTTQQQDGRPDRLHRSQQPLTLPETGVTGERAKRAGFLGIGAVLLLWGIKRRSVRGLVMALVGTAVLARTPFRNTDRDRTDGAGSVNRSPEAEPTPTVTVTRSVAIGKPPGELYEAWRDPDVLSQVMGHFAEITSAGEDRHHWTVHGPGGTELSWETLIVEAESGELVRWETPGDTPMSNSGTVRFRPAPDGRGTFVTLSLDFETPGGTLGAAALDHLEIVPGTLAGHALGRFKSLVESGEIATLEGNPSGRGAGGLV